MTTPFVIVDGDVAVSAVLAELDAAGWRLHAGWVPWLRGWQVTSRRTVCHGAVRDDDDLVAVALAAARGAGIVAVVEGRTDLAARLFDDLSRFGDVDYRRGATDVVGDVPTDEQQQVLGLLGAGRSRDEIARIMHLSRRSVDRRIAAIRHLLEASNTTDAVARAERARTGRSETRQDGAETG